MLICLPNPCPAASTIAYVAAGPGVFIVDTTANAAIATVPITGDAVDVALTPDGRFAYIAVMCVDAACDACGSVAILDTVSHAVTAMIPMQDPGMCRPDGIAITPSGRFLYVTNRDAARVGAAGIVSVIDTATERVVARIPAGDDPGGIAITPNGRSAYVANIYSGTLTRIDTAKNVVTARLAAGPGDVGSPTLSPNGRLVFVSNGCPNSDPHCDYSGISIIDTITEKLTKRLMIRDAGGVAITSNGRRAYVSGENAIAVIDLATYRRTRSIPVGEGSGHLALTPDGRSAYVGNFQSKTVAVIDTTTNAVVKRFPVGGIPGGIAMGRAPEMQR